MPATYTTLRTPFAVEIRLATTGAVKADRLYASFFSFVFHASFRLGTFCGLYRLLEGPARALRIVSEGQPVAGKESRAERQRECDSSAHLCPHQLFQVFEIAAGIGLDVAGWRIRLQIGVAGKTDLVDRLQDLGHFNLPLAEVAAIFEMEHADPVPAERADLLRHVVAVKSRIAHVVPHLEGVGLHLVDRVPVIFPRTRILESQRDAGALRLGRQFAEEPDHAIQLGAL